MFGFGGNYNGPGGGSTNSGSAPSGGAGGKAAEKSGRVGSSTSNAGREGTTSGPGNPGHTASTSNGNSPSEGAAHFGGGGLGQPSKSSGSGSMEHARSVDRAGVTGYAGDSHTHEQDVAEAHADRQTGVGAPGQRMSTNVEGMTAYDYAARRARQVGGVIDQTNIALRSNDLMSPFSLESTYDTRYRPNVQQPVASARQYEISPTALAAGGAKPMDSTADLGTYRTSLPEIDYSFPTAAQVEIDRRERMYPNGPPGLPANFASTYLGYSPNSSSGVAAKGDRVGSGGFSIGDIDPTRFGAAMGATTAETERAAQARAAERTSMNTYDAAARTREDNARMADLAATRRAAEDRSMATYDAATKLSDANALRADAATTVRAQENQSVADLQNRRAALRNTIAGTESPDYNTIYGGAKFSSYDDHPRQAVTITSGPNKGKKSTAAGKYQMLASTWDRVATKLGLPDFSPKSQDLAADYLANEAYSKSKHAKHASLDAALAAGDLKGVSKALSGTWTSLPGGIEQATTTSRFAGQYDQHLAALGAPKNVVDHPVADFASTYLGKDKQKEKDYFGSVPDNQWPGNLEVAQRNGIPAESGDTAAPQQADYTPDPSLTEFPDRPRSNFEKVAAAGLDIGAGLLPGVGLGVGLINGGLSLTGNRTIGTRIVDAIATGKGGKGVPNKGDPEREYQVADSTIPEAAPHTTVPTVEHFVDSYLSPPDKTKYPTPYQRYDLNRNTYAGV